MVSTQEDFRPLDLILQSTGIPVVTGSAPTSAHCFAILLLGPDAPPLPMAASKMKKRKVGDSLSHSVSAVPCVFEPPAKNGKVEGGRPRGRPPTWDVIKYTCSIVDPANSPHSRSLWGALRQRGFPCTRVVCKVRDVLAQGCSYQALQAMQVFSHTSVCPPASSLRVTRKQCRRLGDEVHQWMQEMHEPRRREGGAAEGWPT